MEFEWDEVKSDGCFAERGFDFAYAVRVFLDPDRMIQRDERFDYGEPRYRVLGRIEGRTLRPISERFNAMKRVRVTPERDGSLVRSDKNGRVALKGRIDGGRVDRTSEAEIARQAADDDEGLRRDAAAYARRVRRRTGLTQAAFAARIGVPLDTVRNWEQGKRLPAGPAKALLRVLDRAPEAALTALD